MTEAGYAGNQRYLIISTAARRVLGGIGVARVFQGDRLALGSAGSAAHARGLALAAGVLVLGLARRLRRSSATKIDNVAADRSAG